MFGCSIFNLMILSSSATNLFIGVVYEWRAGLVPGVNFGRDRLQIKLRGSDFFSFFRRRRMRMEALLPQTAKWIARDDVGTYDVSRRTRVQMR